MTSMVLTSQLCWVRLINNFILLDVVTVLLILQDSGAVPSVINFDDVLLLLLRLIRPFLLVQFLILLLKLLLLPGEFIVYHLLVKLWRLRVVAMLFSVGDELFDRLFIWRIVVRFLLWWVGLLVVNTWRLVGGLECRSWLVILQLLVCLVFDFISKSFLPCFMLDSLKLLFFLGNIIVFR